MPYASERYGGTTERLSGVDNMEFKKVQLYYINPLYALYIFLRVRVVISNIWHGIKNVIEKLPDENRDELLKGVK